MDPVVKNTKFHRYHLRYLKAISRSITSENVMKIIGTRLQNLQVAFHFSFSASVCKQKNIFWFILYH